MKFLFFLILMDWYFSWENGKFCTSDLDYKNRRGWIFGHTIFNGLFNVCINFDKFSFYFNVPNHFSVRIIPNLNSILTGVFCSFLRENAFLKWLATSFCLNIFDLSTLISIFHVFFTSTSCSVIWISIFIISDNLPSNQNIFSAFEVLNNHSLLTRSLTCTILAASLLDFHRISTFSLNQSNIVFLFHIYVLNLLALFIDKAIIVVLVNAFCINTQTSSLTSFLMNLNWILLNIFFDIFWEWFMWTKLLCSCHFSSDLIQVF